MRDVLVDGGSTAGGLDTALDGLSHYEEQDLSVEGQQDSDKEDIHLAICPYME